MGGFSFFLFEKNSSHPSTCQVSREIKTVRGHSMEPLFLDGTEVTALMGYFECKKPSRNDIALVSYGGNKFPLIKRIRALPGDTYEFFEREQERFSLVINGEILTNSAGKSYNFLRSDIQEMVRYGSAYGYVIPENRYLILGENSAGSMDSTQFGFLDRDTLIAKVMKK